MRVVLIGCGFLGSIVAEELAKRMWAFTKDLELVLVDDDVIEARNAANHNFTPPEANEAKAEALARRLGGAYYPFVTCEAVRKRVGPDNEAELLGTVEAENRAHLIIDAVDNLETRQWLWRLGVRGEVPVLHLGVSQHGTGVVEWTYKGYDTFSLSPVALLDMTPEDIEKAVALVKLPPCELLAFRSLGVNVALGGAKAYGAAFGFDAEQLTGPEGKGIPEFLTWDATLTGHSVREVQRVAEVQAAA